MTRDWTEFMWERKGCKIVRQHDKRTVAVLSLSGKDEDDLNAVGNLLTAAPFMFDALRRILLAHESGADDASQKMADIARTACINIEAAS